MKTFFALLLFTISLIRSCQARFVCAGSIDYYAQELSPKQRQDFLFYGVQENISSIDSCAKFCFETEFCRSAAFDLTRKRCELAYASVIRCNTVYKNRSAFQPSLNQIVAIYCIDCPSGKKETDDKIDSTTTTVIDIGSSTPAASTPHASTPKSVNDCFKETNRKALLNAAFAIQKGYSVDECQCICSSTWNTTDSIVKCRSFNYFADRRECVLNSADQNTGHQKFPLVNMNDQSIYYEFTCQNDALFAKHYLMKLCSQLNNTPKIQTSIDGADQCFEELSGYVLNGLAGALEHGLSLDQCRCLCASSETSGKYSFPCKSILYYPVEKDCVLNAGNRLERPDLFRKDSTSYKIIYSGITCDSEHAKIYADLKCKIKQPVAESFRDTTVNSFVTDTLDSVNKEIVSSKSDQNAKRPSPGDKTDACFLEISHYLLTGQATALESNVSMAQCKCMCASSKTKYGFVCLSLQYYADLRTCLLNRRNRIQEPSHFIRSLSEDKPLSYFDFLCADDENKIASYQRSVCTFEFLQTTVAATTSTSKNEPVTTTSDRSTGTTPTSTSATTTLLITESTSTPSTTKITTKSVQTELLTTYKSADSLSSKANNNSEYTSKSLDFVSTKVPTVFGPCRYSTFYESRFDGRKLIERTVVGDASICFQHCAQKKCKSANLQNFLGKYKYCEIFTDAANDYPSVNYLTYSSDSVYFEGIQCQPITEQQQNPLFVVI